ncbi:MAG: hypothetical protein OMM_02946 [Candidatus Magnetoglobus multicellularis str. Araruama]|uniref:Uncharacterized protein n=1 Tax=Candidatus Magnetoglobus multicellularis str. Araruama TaxID=890399 RepID=A0A1V1P7G3_9BACT|nr:MAG: hypothetical protein OMM_02946 [Candidatus Magnetoglobus multicellularis str. Araruama]
MYSITASLFLKKYHQMPCLIQRIMMLTTWFASIFKEKTLDVLGIPTAPIKSVSSYKPVDMMISAGMVDIVMEDMNGNVFHIEEQRNMSEEDLCRFAVYHFSASRDWNYKIHDIILISGTSYKGKREIKTPHGTYCPIFVDFTQKDDFKRLKENKAVIDKGDSSVIIRNIEYIRKTHIIRIVGSHDLQKNMP